MIDTWTLEIVFALAAIPLLVFALLYRCRFESTGSGSMATSGSDIDGSSIECSACGAENDPTYRYRRRCVRPLWRVSPGLPGILAVGAKAAASAFHDACAATDVEIHFSQVHREDGPRTGQWTSTAECLASLVIAFETSYFDVPCRATAEEVSDALGISDATLSQRLRRATTNPVSNTVTIGGPTGVGHPDGAADERAGGS